MPLSNLLKKKQNAKDSPKSRYHHQPKSSGWGMIIGLLVALGLAVGLMVAAPRLVSNHLRYFEAGTQEFYRAMYGEP